MSGTTLNDLKEEARKLGFPLTDAMIKAALEDTSTPESLREKNLLDGLSRVVLLAKQHNDAMIRLSTPGSWVYAASKAPIRIASIDERTNAVDLLEDKPTADHWESFRQLIRDLNQGADTSWKRLDTTAWALPLGNSGPGRFKAVLGIIHRVRAEDAIEQDKNNPHSILTP